MSESLCKLIQKHEDKKYYGLCLLSLFMLMWLVVAFTGFAELLSLFSNRHLGLIEAFLFTQIDLLSFQRSGIEVLSNNSWRSVTNDTFLNSFRYWYNVIYVSLWIIALRLLVSKKLNALILDIDFKRTILSIKSLAFALMVGVKKAVANILSYVKLEIKNLNEVKGIEYNSQNEKVDRFDDFITNGQWQKKQQDGKEFIHRVDVEAESNAPKFKECPFCCEQILYRAIKCKHCGSRLEPIPETYNQKVANAAQSSTNTGSEVTWKHYAGIGVVVVFILYALASGNSKKSPELNRNAAEKLCKVYIGEMFNRPIYIIKTEHIKYDGGHFVKANYNRPQDGDYFEYVCHLDNGSITYAGIFNGSDIGRWRYEDEMSYKKNEGGSWVLY